MTSLDVKPLLFGVGERRETKNLGPGGSPGKKRPRALRGEKHGETRAMQPAWLEQKDGPPKYTQKGMPLDRNQPARSKWLQDGGLGEDNLYYLCCSICSTKVAACKFQSRSQIFKSHEASQLHQRAALKWQEIQDRGVCCKVTRMQLHSSQLSAVSCRTNSKPQDAHSKLTDISVGTCFIFVLGLCLKHLIYHVHEHCWEAFGLPASWA